MKTLLLKRHGKRDGSDDALTEVGVDQTKKFGKSLTRMFDEKRVLMLTSPFNRTVLTTSLLLGGAGKAHHGFTVEPDLHENANVQAVLQGIGKHLSYDVDVALCVTHGPVIWDEVDPLMEQKQGIRSKVVEPEAYYYSAKTWEALGINPQQG